MTPERRPWNESAMNTLEVYFERTGVRTRIHVSPRESGGNRTSETLNKATLQSHHPDLPVGKSSVVLTLSVQRIKSLENGKGGGGSRRCEVGKQKAPRRSTEAPRDRRPEADHRGPRVGEGLLGATTSERTA